MNKIELWVASWPNKVLSVDKDNFSPPVINVSSIKTIEQSLEELCGRHVKLSYNWLCPLLIEVENNYSEYVKLIYGTLVPLDTEFKFGFLMDCPAFQSNIFNQIVNKYA